MSKAERNVAEMRGLAWINRSQTMPWDFAKRLKAKIEKRIIQSGVLLFMIGFLLGRAFILSEMMPFALPFFASVAFLRKDRAKLAACALLLGSISQNIDQILFIILAIVLYGFIRKLTMRWEKHLLKTVPLLVFSASVSARVILHFLNETMTTTNFFIAAVEGGLSAILTVIFLQSIPLLSTKSLKRSLKNEEIICFIILLASVMTGTIGWVLYGLSVEHILARYLVLVFAFVGGAAIGSTVGVVTGLILGLANVSSLYHMSLLAFSGLLGGLLKEGKKMGVGIGLLIGTLLIGMYGEGNPANMGPILLESLSALFLFLITPKSAISQIARYIPGTNEHSQEQQQYLRKIRDVTAHRVEQFSALFQTLSLSFSPLNFSEEEDQNERDIDYLLSRVTAKTCQNCFKKEQCWVKQFDKTYTFMNEIMQDREKVTADYLFQKEWDKHCVKAKKVSELIHHELSHYEASKKLRRQVQESRRLVADQLLGVSKVMGNFATEIQKERDNHYQHEDQIIEALGEIGLEVDHIDIYSVKQGNIDIEMTIPFCKGHGECEKVIAPLLSDILDEAIIVKHEDHAHYPHGECRVMFGSAKAFIIETGIANAAKGGAWVSGDSHSLIELSSGKYAIAISDGMGNGERAHLESNDTLELLQKILQSGIDETVAIKSVNSVLSLRTTDEIFSTLDLAILDLQNASARFLKVASTPSFIKRGDQVKTIQSSNLPIGMIQEFDVDVVSEQLKAGDLLIMMSDGIYDGAHHVENKDIWLKRKIREMETEDPQEIADLLMEEVIRTRSGQIMDDMTVIVAKIERNLPKWQTIPRYSFATNRKKAQ
ncbi:stage II sporulation protein E [Bacillus taeanensis]